MLRPLLHFFVLGGLVFAVVQGSGLNRIDLPCRMADAALAGVPVVVDAVSHVQLAADWRARFGTDPTDEDMRQLVAHALDEEILFREALRLGLDEIDPVVRQRLAQNMRFLLGDPAEPSTVTSPGGGEVPLVAADPTSSFEDQDAWIARARAVEMHRSDLVVRRRLVQRMQAAIDARAPTPTRGEVRHFVASNPDLFLSARRARVAYGFDTEELGSALPFRGTFDDDELAAVFGTRFRVALATIAPGTVTGPWRGPHGEAWVRVDEVVSPTPHPFEYIEERASEMLSERARDRMRRETMRTLRLRHGVTPDALAEGELHPARPELAG